jgi:predicted AAA+ superfamily ATPase
MTESFRLDYPACRRVLRERLGEAAPSRIQLLSGPRQVGKTTLLLELAEAFGNEAIYAAADGPEAAVPGFWERLWTRAVERAGSLGRSVILLDEVQHLPEWGVRLKGEWDRVRRRRLRTHVVATGSSALHLGKGSKESLAGRFERLTLTHWSASALVDAFGLSPDEATDSIVRMGGYPGAVGLRHDLARWSAYVRESIVEAAVGRDILALREVRRPGLLRQVFGVAATSPTQIVSLQKIQGQLRDRGALETIAHYLKLLEEAYLIAPLEKYSVRPARRRAAPPKLITLSNALLAVVDPRGIPERGREPDRFGAWVENACLAHVWSAGQRLTYWREEPFEVDAVIDGSWGRCALEVKTGRFDAEHLRGLAEFTRRNPRYRPFVLCDAEQTTAAERLGITAMDWRRFLLEGLAGIESP